MKLTLLIRFLISLIFLFLLEKVSGQCINTYPYSENFETSNGNWTPGGTNSDWSWGSPAKSVITGASSGAKCWIAGTLTQSSYSNNENSTLTSPCFDFTTLASPYITFKLFWETEKKYDGATFQYSIDGGSTWLTLGSYSDFQSCPGNNWFNTTGITALGMDGWSGNIQTTAQCTGGAGNGSGQWKLAQHSISSLAGKNSVRFRFRFAAGSVCNNYDGFAVDDIWIGETSSINSDFSYNCTGSNTINVQPNTVSCGANYSWDFGDPASGTANTSSQPNASHTYLNAGQYSIKLTVQNGSPTPSITTKQVTIIDVNTVIVTPINCYGDNASIQAQVTPAGNYNYQWNSSPPQNSATANNLGGGTYQINVSGNGVCTNSDQITLVEPAKVITFLGNDAVLCSGQTLTLDPGNFSSYLWQNGATTRTFDVTQTGIYSVTVADASSCSASDTIKVTMDCSDIYFPTAFTPNNDSRNDQFGALGNITGITNYTLRIFNRWGQLIFKTNNPSKKWNGIIGSIHAEIGTYVWFVDYKIEARKINRQQKGTITILR